MSILIRSIETSIGKSGEQKAKMIFVVLLLIFFFYVIRKQMIGGLSRVGEGAYSLVYSNGDIAIKKFLWDTQFTHTILREGLLLSHGFGPAFHGLSTNSFKQFNGFIMEACPHTLAYVTDEASACAYAGHVAKTLQKLHKTGNVHGDIKPHNILISKTNTAILCDYGLACLVHGGPLEHQVDQEYYTITYRSPELLQNSGGPLTMYSDLWAFGMTLLSLFLKMPEANTKAIQDFHEEYLVDPVQKHIKLSIIIKNEAFLNFIECLLMIEPTERYIACLPPCEPKGLVKVSHKTPPTKERFYYFFKAFNITTTSTVYLRPYIDLVFKQVLIYNNDTLQKAAADLAVLLNPAWSPAKRSVIGALITVLLIRGSHTIHIEWCAKLISEPTMYFEDSFRSALAVAIMQPQWASFYISDKEMSGGMSSNSNPTGSIGGTAGTACGVAGTVGTAGIAVTGGTGGIMASSSSAELNGNL